MAAAPPLPAPLQRNVVDVIAQTAEKSVILLRRAVDVRRGSEGKHWGGGERKGGGAEADSWGGQVGIRSMVEQHRRQDGGRLKDDDDAGVRCGAAGETEMGGVRRLSPAPISYELSHTAVTGKF